MSGNNNGSWRKTLKNFLKKCTSASCRRTTRRMLGENMTAGILNNNNNNNNNSGNGARNAARARKRRSSMTEEERAANNARRAATRNFLTGETEANRRAARNREWFNAQRAHWASEGIRFRTPEEIAREDAIIREALRGNRNEERIRMEREEAERIAQAVEAERRRREREEMVAELRRAEARRREAAEAEARRREAAEAEFRRREAEAERRRQAEENERRREQVPPPIHANNAEAAACRDILIREGVFARGQVYNTKIQIRKAFLRWALTNHPDKGGNTRIFQIVNDCVDKMIARAMNGGTRKHKKRSTK
jgi:hypothetical protein